MMKEPFVNIMEKGENAGNQQFLLNFLPNDKVSDWSKLKAFADGKSNVTKIEICFGKGKKHCRKRRKCWLRAFSPFATMFSKDFLYRVIKIRDCVGKSFRQMHRQHVGFFFLNSD